MKSIFLSLWVALSTVAPAHAASPSFDCTKADSAAEKLVCTDAQLAILDRETARLFELARDGPHMTAERRAELVATQRGWIKGRNDCWKTPDLRACVLANYVIRMHELRQGYADARRQDAHGISHGPKVVTCPDFDALMSATFVNAEPALAYITWRDQSYVLTHTLSGSGAKYTTQAEKGEVVLWTKGDDAIFEFPGHSSLTCRIGEPG